MPAQINSSILVRVIRTPGEKRVIFRAKISQSGKRKQIIIPKYYYEDLEKAGFLDKDKVILVDVREITDSVDEFSY